MQRKLTIQSALEGRFAAVWLAPHSLSANIKGGNMGAWGLKNFENDDACDWVYELEKSKDKSIINKAFDKVLESTEYIESPDCCEALAAAEVVLAGISNNHSGVTEDIVKWLNKQPGLFKKPIIFESSDVEKAIKTIRKILESSELKELWKETDDYEQWKRIEGLLLENLTKFA